MRLFILLLICVGSFFADGLLNGPLILSNVKKQINFNTLYKQISSTSIGHVDTLGTAVDIVLSQNGNLAYIADGDFGLQIIDISISNSPIVIGTLNTHVYALSIVLSNDGTKIYLASAKNGMIVIDVVNPINPKLIGFIDTGSFTRDIILSPNGKNIFVADLQQGLQVVDLATNTILARLDLEAPNKLAVSKNGKTLYIADKKNGFIIVNVESVSSPSVISTLAYNEISHGLDVVALSNDETKVFVAKHNGDFKVVDVSDSLKPTFLGTIESYGSVGIIVSNNNEKAYMIKRGIDIQVINISDSNNLVNISNIKIIGNAYALAFSNNETLMYIASDKFGLQIIDMSTVKILSSLNFIRN
ncbi:MAG: hypothetical protein COB02_16015 [Candidatus Cloacimonadota bacterium]|nr:MAG: hypothetical protein COB02_16015 [Candidatus Cloacimonadota bacterium]